MKKISLFLLALSWANLWVAPLTSESKTSFLFLIEINGVNKFQRLILFYLWPKRGRKCIHKKAKMYDHWSISIELIAGLR